MKRRGFIATTVGAIWLLICRPLAAIGLVEIPVAYQTWRNVGLGQRKFKKQITNYDAFGNMVEQWYLEFVPGEGWVEHD